MNYILAFLGFALFIIMGMIKTKNKHLDKKFSPVQYLKDEILTLIASAISVIILLFMLPEIDALITPEYAKWTELLSKIIPAAIGFLNYTLFDRILNTVISKKFIEK